MSRSSSSRKVWAVRLTPDWVEFRAGAKAPVLRKSHVTVTTMQERYECLEERDKWGFHMWGFVKRPITYKIGHRSILGGRVLGVFSMREYKHNAKKYNDLPVPSAKKPIVEMPPEWAQNLLDPQWRKENL